MRKLYNLDGIPGIKNGRLTVLVSKFWFSPCQLYLDNQSLSLKDGRYYIQNEQGETVVIKLKRIGFDLIPQVSVNEHKAEPMLDKPFSVFDNLWVALPFWALSLSFTLGAMIIVFISFYFNCMFIRKYISDSYRYLFAFIPTFFAFVILIKISEFIHSIH